MRLFIGVPIPTSPKFTQACHELKREEPTARPVPAGTWHVTLRFLGEVKDPAPVEDALHKAVAGHAAMPVTVRGLGAFQSPRKARVVWARVQAEGLRGLALDVVDATAEVGQPARKDFVAHATLARLKAPRNIEPFIERHKSTVFCEGSLDTVVLYRSRLTPQGPVYDRLRELPLPRMRSAGAADPGA